MNTRSCVTSLAAAAAILLGTSRVNAQAGSGNKPQLAEDVFKNVQVLKGLTVNQFMETMGFFSAATLLNCADCHTIPSSGNWDSYAEDTPRKRTARKMVLMARGINQNSFGGSGAVTCYTCHRGDERPRVVPDLTEMYSTPNPVEPDQIVKQAAGAPTIDAVLDKYIRAIGGAQKVGGLNSIVARGVYEGSAVSLMPGDSPVEIFMQAPNRRTTIFHAAAGDATLTTDGNTAWTAAATVSAPLPLLPLTGTDLDAANVEAMLAFPARIRQSFTNWRVGFPFSIDNNAVQVVQGTSPGKLPVLLYFDSKSGLLVRSVRYKDVQVGRIPYRADYSDYRDVSGVKVPFVIKLTDVAGEGTIRLTEVRLNVPVDAAKFGRPNPPKPQ